MTGPFHWFSQLASVTRFSLLTVPRRKGATAAAAFGIAGVVAVLVGTLSIAQGFRQAMVVSGRADVAIVMRGGSDSEMVSFLSGAEVRLVP